MENGNHREAANQFLDLMLERSSSRQPFNLQRRVPPEDLWMILEAARWSPTANNIQNYEILVVDDPLKLEKMNGVPFETPKEYLRENFQHLSFTGADLKKKKRGVLALDLPVSWMMEPASLEHLPDSARKGLLGERLEDTPLLLLVVTDPRKRTPASNGDRLGAIGLGCVMENMWLMAQALGLGFQVTTVLCESPTEEEVRKIFGIPEPLRIAYGCRIGYLDGAHFPSFRVRRDITDFVHYNYWLRVPAE